ncbi:MAG: type II toxin-antitoxin system PemK/MazF family toxin [Euzebya sp.]
MNRGDVWLAEAGGKRRPVLVLTRSEVIDVRTLVTVAEITTSVRGLAVEVGVDHIEAGIDRASVINCDGLHTIARTTLTTYVGSVDDTTLQRVCSAINHALGC